MSARDVAIARTSAPGSSGPSSSRERPCAIAERTSSRFAMLFEAGTRTRLSTSGWRTGAIGWMSCTECEDYVRSCMYTPAERIGQAVVVMVGLVFALTVGGFILRGGQGSHGIGSTPAPSASPSGGAPTVKFTQDTC